MTSKKDKRRQAYKFIYNKLHESACRPGNNTVKSSNVTAVISLAEIDRLKEGTADPSEELISALKMLLYHTDSEHEIEEYLIKPFLSGSRSSR